MLDTRLLKILLVDDDEDDYIIVRDLLSDSDSQYYDVTWACNGDHALSELVRHNYDACLIDYRLGREDGINVLRQISSSPQHPAIVVVTGQGNEEVDRMALDLGASDYLLKQELTSRSLDRSIRYAVSQRRTHLLLEEREASLWLSQRAIEAAVNGIVICDARYDHPITYVNAAFERITGYPSADVIGRNPRFLNGETGENSALLGVRNALQARGEAHVVLPNYTKDGTLFWNDMHIAPVPDVNSGLVTHFIGVINDVTDNKRYEEELVYQANHDALTGLPNRNLLKDRLLQAISFSSRHQSLVAVMFIDLDQFKVINDGIGHHVGDAVLKNVGNRLVNSVRECDTVARTGGDEFVVVCPDLEIEENALDVMRRIYECLARPLAVHGDIFNIGASMGVSFYPKDGTEPDVLLRHADLAMYRAKENGRGNYQYFTPDLNTRISQRVHMEARLRSALEAQEFELYYQPQVNAVSGAVTGMEALIRWHDPALGLVMPGQFIQIAEESGLIIQIGDWVLYEACSQSVAWQKQHGIRIPVAINISVAQIKRRDFSKVVSAALRETGMEPSLLELELTESMVMENAEMFVGLVQQLKTLGVRITIDDFGTGYSSLAYLKRLPVDKLKIDRTFVRDIVVDPGDAAICRAIIAMAHNMQIGVVAEGVETESQAVYLGRNFCDELQGFYITRPTPSADVPALLNGHPLFTPPPELKSVRTLLIVDDEPNVITSLKRLLRADGYNILTTTSTEIALELLASRNVSVVIADQRMPGMTGAELLERVKELHPRTVRIVLSGFTDLSAVTASINRGAVYKFLMKPWDNEHLRGVIREAFWHAELNQFAP